MNPIAALASLGQQKQYPASTIDKYRASLPQDYLQTLNALRQKVAGSGNTPGYGNSTAQAVFAPGDLAMSSANAAPGMVKKIGEGVQQTMGIFSQPKPSVTDPSPQPQGVEVTKTSGNLSPDALSGWGDEDTSMADDATESNPDGVTSNLGNRPPQKPQTDPWADENSWDAAPGAPKAPVAPPPAVGGLGASGSGVGSTIGDLFKSMNSIPNKIINPLQAALGKFAGAGNLPTGKAAGIGDYSPSDIDPGITSPNEASNMTPAGAHLLNQLDSMPAEQALALKKRLFGPTLPQDDARQFMGFGGM